MSTNVETNDTQLFTRRARSLRHDICADVRTENGFPKSHVLIICTRTEEESLHNPQSLPLESLSLVENTYTFEDKVTVS